MLRCRSTRRTAGTLARSCKSESARETRETRSRIAARAADHRSDAAKAPPTGETPVRRTITTALGLLIASGVQLVTAQTPPQATGPGAQAPAPAAEVRGKVIDMKSDAPIARASVSVRPKGATTILAGAIANADGSFRVTGLRPGAYSLRVTFIG